MQRGLGLANSTAIVGSPGQWQFTSGEISISTYATGAFEM